MSCNIFLPKLRYELMVPAKCSIACTPEHYSIVTLQLIFPLLSSPRDSNETVLALFHDFTTLSFPMLFKIFEISLRKIMHFTRRRDETKMIEAA